MARLRLPEDNPVWSAALGASLYVGIATVYILLSGRVAAELAGSVEQLQTIEAIKGYAFVVVTGILFFFISLGWWRTRRQQRQLLIRSERQSVAAMYSSALAHDLNNMVMVLSVLVENLKDHDGGDAGMSELKRSLDGTMDHLASLSKRLASSARESQTTEPTDMDFSGVLAQMVALARKHPAARYCAFNLDAPADLALRLNRDLFEQAVLNMLVNAAQAAGPRGRIEITVKREREAVTLQIHDDGPGIPPDKIQSVFGVGYTTKCDGSGIGLLSVQAFAASCRARISVLRSPLGGALFALRIPLDQVCAQPLPSGADAA